MGVFSGYLICSDIDGTFSVNTKAVPENIEAAKYFTQNGGKFTIATGRTAAYLKKLEFFDCINAPACICNGSVVYDYENEKILQKVNEDFTLEEFLTAVNKYTHYLSGLYVYYTPQTVQAPNNAHLSFSREELENRPIKIVCTFDDVKSARDFKDFCLSHPLFKNTYIANSWDTGLEFNSNDGTKGSAVRYIKEYLEGIHTSVAIGDYENDIPMLKEADIAVCVGDGSQEVKRSADFTVKNAKDGAVADLVRKLEEKILSGELR